MSGFMLTPIPTMTAGSSSSSVKSLSFFLLFAGLVFVIVGYMRSEDKCPPPRVEFRYVPRTFEQEQNNPPPVLSVFGKMFSDRDPLSKIQGYVNTFPWEQANINSMPVTDYTDHGVNRAVGQRVLGS